jgi:arylsulfatase A-like enzyme
VLFRSSIDLLPTILEIYNIPPKKETPGRSLIRLLESGKWNDDRVVYVETGIGFSDIGDHFFQKQRIFYPNILQLHQIVPEANFQIMITDPYYRETIAFAKHRAVLNSNYKLIYIPTHDGILWEAYDRKKDPLNQKNIYYPYQFERLKKELYSLVQLYESAKIVGSYILPEEFKD